MSDHFLICATFIEVLWHELTLSEMFVTLFFLWKEIARKTIKILSLVQNIQQVSYVFG